MTENTASSKAVILLSGGLDSTTTLAIAKDSGFAPYALSFDYGQKNRFELERAAVIARHYQAVHKQMRIDLRAFGGSSLTSDAPVERGRALSEIGRTIPSTYVPARNTVFLSFALAWAEVLGAYDIFIGVNAVDTSGYPDCRPEFIEAFTCLANTAVKASASGGKKFEVHAPLLTLNKAEIIRTGLGLHVDYSLTNTCYDPLNDGKPCGVCDACILRRRGFLEAGTEDPLPYPAAPQ